MSLAGREEATLEAIWTKLRDLLDLPPACGPQYELDAEREVLAPNAIVLERVAQARAAGGRIVFVSDTYLPAEFVEGALRCHGAAAEGDGIYVSSALGRTKRGGGLYREMLKAEKVAADAVHHYGDNPHSDVDVPRRLGIAATLLADARFNQWERAILNCEAAPDETAARLVGSMRLFRLSASREFNSGVRDLVATFLGPAAMLWAAWVLAAARRDGVRRLYFAARDAHLVWRAARVLAPRFGDIDCRYLKISRQSVLLPAVEDISPDGIPWLLRSWEIARLDRLIPKLGLQWQEVARHFAPLAKGEGPGKQLTTEQEWKEFWAVLQTPALKALLTARIAERRETALAYLKAEGFCDDMPIGIADLGWYLTVQTGLQRLSARLAPASTRSQHDANNHNEARRGARNPAPLRLRGYYLGLLNNRNSPSAAGPSTGLFYHSLPDQGAIIGSYEIFRRATVLEHVLGLAAHGTIREYRFADAHVKAVCESVPSGFAEIVGRIVNAIEAFCSNCLEPEIYSDERCAQSLLDALIQAWFTFPCKEALPILAQIEVSSDPNNLGADRMIKEYSLRDAVIILLPGRMRSALKLSVPTRFWPEASLCISKTWPARLIRLRGRVDRLLSAIRRRADASSRGRDAHY
jgi:FMN phosphatase YigB (HAD superfamily)